MSWELAVAGIGALSGMLQSQAERRRIERAQQQYLRELGESLDREYRAAVERNRLSLYTQAGAGGDALRALGSNLGSAAAAGGVYNSSAVSGALAKQASDLQSALMQLALQQRLGEAGILASNRARLSETGLGMLSQRLGQAYGAEQAAGGGLASFLGSLTQYNLMRRGVPSARAQGVAMNGNQNAKLMLSPLQLQPAPTLGSFLQPLIDVKRYGLR